MRLNSGRQIHRKRGDVSQGRGSESLPGVSNLTYGGLGLDPRGEGPLKNEGPSDPRRLLQDQGGGGLGTTLWNPITEGERHGNDGSSIFFCSDLIY